MFLFTPVIHNHVTIIMCNSLLYFVLIYMSTNLTDVLLSNDTSILYYGASNPHGPYHHVDNRYTFMLCYYYVNQSIFSYNNYARFVLIQYLYLYLLY